MNNELKIGATVKHVDGTIGHVVAIHEPIKGARLIEWKTVKTHRTSPEQTLTIINANQFRWRNPEAAA